MQVRRDAPAASILLQARGRSREPESVEGRFIDAIEVFVSSLASACRVDVRQPNTLSAYRDKLAKKLPPDSCSMNDVLSYVLQLAPDLFGFYLLLWEVLLTASFQEEV
jgi:hypothetical protein